MTGQPLTVSRSLRAPAARDRNLFRLLIMLAFVFVLMTALRPAIFLRPAHFNSTMRQFPEYGIMAIGISLTMITCGIDLAVVGTANLSAIIAARFAGLNNTSWVKSGRAVLGAGPSAPCIGPARAGAAG